jgi:hypothetical protein
MLGTNAIVILWNKAKKRRQFNCSARARASSNLSAPPLTSRWEALDIEGGTGVNSAIMSDFADEATRIVDKAQEKGIVIRVMGATVIRKHCPEFLHLHTAMKRELSDIDFMTYSKFNPSIKPLFVELGYEPDERFNAYFGIMRQQYRDHTNRRIADVFFDKLEMCHTIDFRGRLELDYPTITLADFLLEKMQIVQLNEKDKIDTIVLLREHGIGDFDKETINAAYIAKLLAKDWGFYYTVTTNLSKVKEYARSTLSEEDSRDVVAKIDQLLEWIEKEPKTTAWKMRARIGPKKKWYRDVEEVIR